MIRLSPPRWDPYVLLRDNTLKGFWERQVSDGARVALVMGRGFDPRMCLGLELFRTVAPADAVEVHGVRFNLPGDATARRMAEENDRQFASLLGRKPVSELKIESGGVDPVARSAVRAVPSLAPLGEVTDVVVDINALPRPVFFPLVAKLLYLCDAAGTAAPNLHILAGDAAWLDEEIRGAGVNEHAAWLHPFEGTFSVEATDHVPRVWMPILGEETQVQLERIRDLVGPEEVCPVLPFPSKDPRRGDKLFEEHREVLFDRLRTDSGTVVYADEANPFQVYRRLREATVRYRETLEPLNGSKTAYSALSSKLVAVGALLVAYELRDQLEVGVADIGSQRHVLDRTISIEEAAEGTELIGLTLSGESYN